jgi:peptidoglycan/LPS O-acetylase OafA/YrhL
LVPERHANIVESDQVTVDSAAKAAIGAGTATVAAPMQRGLSLYLDLLRFVLALTVMIGHASDPSYVGASSVLAHFPQYGLTSVIGFFVLSGFVIAHVTQGSERDPRRYFAARASRMYSVVLPALLLTAVLGICGALIDPTTYAQGPIPIGSHQPLRYFLTALFIQNFWIWPKEMTPGVNHPFWSLSYEVTYYVIFGLMLTRRPLAIAAGSVVLLILAGPTIGALFPIWLLGVAAYHALRRFTLPLPVAVLLLTGSIAGLYISGAHRGLEDPVNRFGFDYVEGLLFAVNIFAAGCMAPLLNQWLGWCPRFVRWLGMLTFALYVCHRPLLYFFSALRVAKPTSSLQLAWLFGMTLLVVIGMAHLGEWLRGLMRARLFAGNKRPN